MTLNIAHCSLPSIIFWESHSLFQSISFTLLAPAFQGFKSGEILTFLIHFMFIKNLYKNTCIRIHERFSVLKTHDTKRQNVNYCGELKISTVESEIEREREDIVVCFFGKMEFIILLKNWKIWGIFNIWKFIQKNLSRVHKIVRILLLNHDTRLLMPSLLIISR